MIVSRSWRPRRPRSPRRRSVSSRSPTRCYRRSSTSAKRWLAGAPVIHDESDTAEILDPDRNIVHHIGAERGDVEAALAAASHVFEQTFRVHQVQQCPIEPHISIAWIDEDERMVIRTATQVPFHTRRMVAPLLGMDVKDIRVIKPRIGGGFGAKQEMLIEDIVGHLAIATRRPVRLELDRAEEFMSSRTRHPQTITYRTGVDDDGNLVAQDMYMIGNTGPYGTHGYTVQTVSGLRGLSSYNAPNKRFVCDVVYTNIPVPGAYRGYGAPQAEFALEAHMEDIARDLDIDVIDFKRRNWVTVGSEIDIAPHLGERSVEEGELDEYPKVMSSGIEECVAQAPARDRLASPRRPSVEAADRSPSHPARHRLRLLHARHRDPVPRHGRLLDQAQRRRFVQHARRRHRPRHRGRHRARPDSGRGARCAPRRHQGLLVATPT